MEQKFSQVFDINPKLKLNKNQKIDFVEMKDIEPGKRSVVSKYKKEFKGSGSKFERGDTLFARITPCLENGKISIWPETIRLHVLQKDIQPIKKSKLQTIKS